MNVKMNKSKTLHLGKKKRNRRMRLNLNIILALLKSKRDLILIFMIGKMTKTPLYQNTKNNFISNKNKHLYFICLK